MIQPASESFQLAQRSPATPREARRSRMTAPKVLPSPSGSTSTVVCTGTLSALATMCSRSATIGPSKRWMYSSGAPVTVATSSADMPERMWACTSRGREFGCVGGRFLPELADFECSTSSMAMRKRSPSSPTATSDTVLDSDDLQILHSGCLPSYGYGPRMPRETRIPGNNSGVPEVENRAIAREVSEWFAIPRD